LSNTSKRVNAVHDADISCTDIFDKSCMSAASNTPENFNNNRLLQRLHFYGGLDSDRRTHRSPSFSAVLGKERIDADVE
jgi:hypothetical protein